MCRNSMYKVTSTSKKVHRLGNFHELRSKSSVIGDFLASTDSSHSSLEPAYHPHPHPSTSPTRHQPSPISSPSTSQKSSLSTLRNTSVSDIPLLPFHPSSASVLLSTAPQPISTSIPLSPLRPAISSKLSFTALSPEIFLSGTLYPSSYSFPFIHALKMPNCGPLRSMIHCSSLFTQDTWKTSWVVGDGWPGVGDT
jgi:hypothetical protein